MKWEEKIKEGEEVFKNVTVWWTRNLEKKKKKGEGQGQRTARTGELVWTDRDNEEAIKGMEYICELSPFNIGSWGNGRERKKGQGKKDRNNKQDKQAN